jgi:hypothetical protein
MSADACTPIITVADVTSELVNQKKGKAVGHDGIHMEAFMYGGHKLRLYLCFLFTMRLKHGFVPDSFLDCAVIPLVKNKAGDLSDTSNYRATSFSFLSLRFNQIC